jgi:hypothetical protein
MSAIAGQKFIIMKLNLRVHFHVFFMSLNPTFLYTNNIIRDFRTKATSRYKKIRNNFQTALFSRFGNVLDKKGVIICEAEHAKK